MDLYNKMLGLCCCGNPDEVHTFLTELLGNISERSNLWDEKPSKFSEEQSVWDKTFQKWSKDGGWVSNPNANSNNCYDLAQLELITRNPRLTYEVIMQLIDSKETILEHGSSIFGSFLSIEGEELLQEMKKGYEED